MNVINFLTPKSQVAWVYADVTVRQGLEKLRARGYTAIPVLDREGLYIGTVSEGDFLWHMLDSNDNSLRTAEQLPLRSVLREGFNPPVSVRVTMEELLERAMSQSFVPVVDDRGAFMGIVTRQTILRRLAEARDELPTARRRQPAMSAAAM